VGWPWRETRAYGRGKVVEGGGGRVGSVSRWKRDKGSGLGEVSLMHGAYGKE